MIAGFPSENAGMDDIPLVLRLTTAPAFNLVLVLSPDSPELEQVKRKSNNRQNEILIFSDYT
jgi:hypothetical protein